MHRPLLETRMSKTRDLMMLRGLAMQNTYGITEPEREKLARDYDAQLQRCRSLYGFDAAHRAIFYGDYGAETTGGSDA
jgi:hypothetical protein